MNVLFPIALQLRLLSVWNIIQLRMYIFTLHVIFPLVLIQKKRALCDNCLVYSTSFVSNNYLGSNNCSVENNFHFTSECLVSYCSSVKTTVCMKHYPVENVCLYTSLHFPIVSNQKSIALFDNCLVYSPSLVSNNYLGSNNCSVDNHFHFSSECLVSYCSSIYTIVCMKHYPVENVCLYTSLHFPIVSNQKRIALFDNCLVYCISLVSNNYRGSNNCSVENNWHLLVNVLFTSALLFRLQSVWNIIQFRMLSLHCTSYSPLFGFRKAVLFAITVLYTVTL